MVYLDISVQEDIFIFLQSCHPVSINEEIWFKIGFIMATIHHIFVTSGQ